MTQGPSGNTPTYPYPWPWLGSFGIFVLGLLYVMLIRPQIPTFHPREQTAASLEDDTYLLIQFPPVYTREVSASDKAELWLAALTSKGYHPALLSDVYQRLDEGKGLPDKTVVILFDPGTRATFEVMAPLLAKYKFPAVWITNGQTHRQGDKRYVSSHVLHAMKNSGTWDVGTYEANSALVIEPYGSSSLTIGKDKGAWWTGAGRRALNRGIPAGSLDRLFVNWNWTAQQIIDRLEAEEPLRGKGTLTMRKIQDHNWGVVILESSSQDSGFSLKAPGDSRTANLSWLGTKWCNDAEVNISVKGLTGELWLMMRSDEMAGESVGVCFLKGKLSITRQKNHKTDHLVDISVPSLEQPASFSAQVLLKGSDIAVTLNGVLVGQAKNLPKPSSQEGIIRLMAYDKINGAAQVESVKISAIRLEINNKKSEFR